MTSVSTRKKICLNSEHFEVPTDRFPVVIDIVIVERFYPIVGCFIGILLTTASGYYLYKGNQDYPALTYQCMLIGGISCLIWSVLQLGRTRRITISEKSIKIENRYHRKRIFWKGTINDFEGIRIVERQVSHGQYSTPTVYTVELHHLGGKRSIQLFQSRSKEEAEAQAQLHSSNLRIQMVPS